MDKGQIFRQGILTVLIILTIFGAIIEIGVICISSSNTNNINHTKN